MDNDNLRSLHKTLQGAGYNPPEYDEFARDMENEENLRGVYSTLKNEGYTPPDYEQFKSDMGFGMTHDPKYGSKSTIDDSPYGTVKEPKQVEWQTKEGNTVRVDTVRPSSTGKGAAIVEVEKPRTQVASDTSEDAQERAMLMSKESLDDFYSYEPNEDGKMTFGWKRGANISRLNDKGMRLMNATGGYENDAYLKAEKEAEQMSDEQLIAAFNKLSSVIPDDNPDALAGLPEGYEDASVLRAYARELRMRDVGYEHASQMANKGEYRYMAARAGDSGVASEIDALESLPPDQQIMRLRDAYRQYNAMLALDKQGLMQDEDYDTMQAARRTLAAATAIYAKENNVFSEEAYQSVMNMAANSIEKQTGFGAGFKQGVEAMSEGVRHLAGEVVSLIEKSRGDYGRAQEEVEKYGEDAEEAVLSEYASNWWKLLSPLTALDFTRKTLDAANLLRAINDVFSESRGSDGHVDLNKANRLMEQRMKQELGIGEGLMRRASINMSNMPQVEGTGAWMGQNVAQMFPSATAMLVAVTTKSPTLAQAIGNIGMGIMVASSAGSAMQEARQYGASDDEVWMTGISNGMLEWVTEKIPFDRYTKRVFGGVKARTTQRLLNALQTPEGRKEFNTLLKRAKKELASSTGIKAYAGDVLAEGASEFAAGVSQRACDIIYKDREDYPTLWECLEDGWDGALSGAFMGATLGGVSVGTTRMQTDNRRKQAGKVTIGFLNLDDGGAQMVEVLGTDAQGNVTILRGDGAQPETVKADAIPLMHTYSYADWHKGEMQRFVDDATDEGYHLEGATDMQDAKNSMEVLRERLSEFVADDLLSEFDNDPTGALSLIDNNEQLSEEQKQTAFDYVKARAAYDGMVQKVRDDINTAIEEANERIDAQTNADTGMVQHGTLVDGSDIHVIGGTVFLDDNGHVDRSRSTPDLIVMDGDGNKKFIGITELADVDEAIAPDQLKNETFMNIREQMSSEAADKIDGTLGFNVGDVYQLPYADGVVHTFQVVEPIDDNTVAVLVDGGQEPTPMLKSDLQGMADAAARERVILAQPAQNGNEQDAGDGGGDEELSEIELAHRELYSDPDMSVDDNNQLVLNNIAAAQKALEKAQKANEKPINETDREKYKAERKKRNEAIEQAQAQLDYWQGIKGVQDAIEKAERDRAAAERAERDRIAHEKAVAEVAAEEAARRAADEEQRRLGAGAAHPAIREKWDAAEKIDGHADEIVLPNGERMQGHYVLVEAGAATPSHNPTAEFAKNEGFPVDENGQTINDRDYERDKDAQDITREMGRTYDSRAVQDVPVVSRDGVVLSGNGRTMAGELAAQQDTDGAYIDYLRNYGGKFGFTPDQVNAMRHPRVVFVPDGDMPYTTDTFAKFNAQEKKGMSVTELAVKLGKTVPDDVFRRILQVLNEYETLGAFYADTKAATGVINELRNAGVIGANEYGSMFDGDTISERGKEMIESMLIGKAFEGSPDAIRQLTEFKSLRQSVVSALSEIVNNIALGDDYSLADELSAAIDLCYKARKAGIQAGKPVSGFARQGVLFPADGEATVADYTNATMLMLADTLNDNRSTWLRRVLAKYNGSAADAAAGGIDLFSGSRESRQEIITNVINYLNNGFEQQETGNKEPEQAAVEQPSGDREGVQQDGAAGDGAQYSEIEVSEPFSPEEADRFLASMEHFAVEDPVISLTPESWISTFGINNSIETPLGRVKMGENQYEKLVEKNRTKEFGMVAMTLQDPDVVFIEPSEAKDGQETERPYSYVFVKTFVKDGKKIRYYASVTVKRDGMEVSISSHHIKNTVIRERLETMSRAYTKESLLSNSSEWHLAEQQNAVPDLLPTQESSVSDGKVSVISGTGKENDEKVSENNASTAIAAAEQEVNTAPSDAQKEAGNYKKGHIRLDGFDITIENPKGSTRSGKDASGNEWSVTMQNTYGYIRGTEGIDGDHIDVFLSDNMDGWNGTVYVVDQVNPDGSFDEHKVMYGFNSPEEAAEAYNSNYSEGWQGLGTITGVGVDEFKKWIESSHRKTKPFAEYKNIKTDAGQHEASDQQTDSGQGNASTYETTAGGETHGKLPRGSNADATLLDPSELPKDNDRINKMVDAWGEVTRAEVVGVNDDGTTQVRLWFEYRPNQRGIDATIGYPQEPTAAFRRRRVQRQERKRQSRLLDRARRWSDKTGVEFVILYSSKDLDLIKNTRTRKLVQESIDAGNPYPGWYDVGKVFLYLPGITGLRDLDATVIHEAVSHKGLRDLMGDEGYGRLCDDVYKAVFSKMDKESSEYTKYDEYPGGNANESEQEHHRRMANEWIARNAEDVDVDGRTSGVWRNIVAYVKRWLREAGLHVSFSDKELESLIRQSYRKMVRENAVSSDGRVDASTYDGTDGGETTDNGNPLFRLVGEERERVEKDNNSFNAELAELTEDNADSKIFDLGTPSSILQSVGVALKPMRLYGNKVISKARKHGFLISELRNLPMAISDPIAIFKGSDNDSHSILTELHTDQGNILVNLSVGKDNDVDFNIIRSVYGKNEKGVVNWILSDKLLYADKERALNYLRTSAPIADARLSQELNDAAKVIENFENPKINSEKNSENTESDSELFRVKDEEQTRSENFKAWFGDWENDPENASKIVDADGKPLVVYHGDKSKERYEFGPNTFFTPSEEYAKRYTQGTGDVKAYYLDIKHPFDIRDERSRGIFTAYRNGHEPAQTPSGAMDWAEYDYDDLQEYLEQNYPGEFDGFVLDEGGDGGYGEAVKERGLSYVPFRANQVKSATENNGDFSRENNDVRFREGDEEPQRAKQEKTLMGVHNISSEKLRKALKLGGLANPSMAIIDTAVSGFDNFGEISLIPGSSLIDKRTGRNAGTWSADAYTPRFPETYRRLGKGGDKKLNEWVDGLGMRDEMARNTLYQFNDYYNSFNIKDNALVYPFLFEKGLSDKVDYVRHEKVEPSLEEEINEANGDLDALMNRFDNDEAFKKKITDIVVRDAYRQITRKADESFSDFVKRKAGMLGGIRQELTGDDGYVIRELAEGVLQEQAKAYKRDGKFDENRTLYNAVKYITDNNLQDEYAQYFDEKMQELGAETQMYAGSDRMGRSKFKPFNLEDASRKMKKAGRAGGEGGAFDYSPGSIRAKLLSPMKTLSQIRKEKGKIVDNETFDAAREEYTNDLLSYANTYTGGSLEKLGDILTAGNMEAMAKEYGISLSADDVAELEAFKERIKALPSEYFETKFERPVYLNEFRAAVVPDNLAADLRRALENSGLEIVEYKDNDAEDRRRALLDASEGEGIRFREGDAGGTDRERSGLMSARAEQLGQKLGVNVRLVQSRSDLPSHWTERQKRRRKGWYNKSTGEIVIVVPNNNSVADVEATVLHEIVGHKGLRELFGKDFDRFLDDVFNNVDAGTRRKIVDRMMTNGWDVRKATEEYLASLAESTDFDSDVNRSAWQKIKDLFMSLLRKAGVKLSIPLTDADLRYVLWRSYQRRVDQGAIGVAADVVMREKLGVDGGRDESRWTDGELMFRDSGFTVRDRTVARDEYERIIASGGYQFQEAVQDSMLGLKRLMQSVLGKDIHVEDVAGYENAYLAENRMSSVNAAEQHEYYVRYMKPLLESIGKICGADNAARASLIDYLMAKHGLERNLVLAERDAREAEKAGGNYQDAYTANREKDYSGLTALTGEADVSAAEAVAQQMVADYEQDHDVTELWRAVNAATDASLAKVYQSGLLTPEKYDEIRQMFNYYIPLQGWDETTSDEVYGYLAGHDRVIGGAVIKRAEGRRSLADDPIATIAMQADASIRQGNRNLMKRCFLNFVQNHPSDLVSVNQLWLHYNDVTDEWEPVFADINDGDTGSDVERKVAAFEAHMEQLAANDPDNYKRGSDARNIPYKVVKGNLREHQVLVKRNGINYVLTINGNPRAAQALNGLTNPDVDISGIVGNMLKGAEFVNRNLSAFYTTRNPDFVVSNFFRDMLYSNCMSWVKEGRNYALRFHWNFGKVNPYKLRKLIGKWESGTLDDSVYMERMFKQFMLGGGETGYTSVKDIEGHKRTIINELKRQGSFVRNGWHVLGLQLDMLNRAVENCARFAAFVTSRELGRSLERSIYDAKEVSVNFNKKGSGGKMVNATGQTTLGKIGSYIGGGCRLLYVFWNAGVQGSTNFGRAFKRHPVKSTAGAASMFLLGAVIPLLAKWMSGDDDDDKDAYYNLPEYVRRSNILLKAGNQWIAIPLPIEFRALYGLGELATGVITGKERYSNSELAFHIASEMSQVLPLDMLEGGGGISPWIPSLAKPVVEAYMLNKSWSGLPIYKDSPFNQSDPEWTKAYKNANRYLVSGAKWLNEISGGDDYKKGAIDINPAKVEYLLSGMFGGAFTTVDKLVKMVETQYFGHGFGDREFDWRNMLIANRIIKTGDERTAERKLKNEYFKYKEEYEETKRLLKKYDEASDSGIAGYAERLNFLNYSKEFGRYQIFDAYQGLLDAYRESGDTDGQHEVMRELVDLLHDYDDGKNMNVGAVVDSRLRKSISGENSEVRKKAANELSGFIENAEVMGDLDAVTKEKPLYTQIYEAKKTYDDTKEDALIDAHKKRAEAEGDAERAYALEYINKYIIANVISGKPTKKVELSEEIREKLGEYADFVLYLKRAKHDREAGLGGLGGENDDKVFDLMRALRGETLDEFDIKR